MKWAAGGLSIPQRPLSATAVAASRGQHDSTANHLRGFQMRWGRRSGGKTWPGGPPSNRYVTCCCGRPDSTPRCPRGFH